MPASSRRLLALTASLSLLGGAAATVLVAWGFGLWGTVAATRSEIQKIKPQALASAPIWSQSALQGASGSILIEHPLGPGLSDEQVIATSGPVTNLRLDLLSRHRAGWPAAALETTYNWTPGAPRVSVMECGIVPPAWLARSRYDDLRSPRPPLPLRPIPLGFTLDTLFYAAILAALFLAPPRLRRFLRLRRGLCPACAYNLTGNTTGICPECGGETPTPHAGSGPHGKPSAGLRLIMSRDDQASSPAIEPSAVRAAAALCAEGARAVYLFGSRGQGGANEASDLDLAVEGLPPQRFFRALAKACDAAGEQVDLIDLDEDNAFTRHVRRAGVLQRVA